MAAPWFTDTEVVAVLDNLDLRSLKIRRTPGEARFEWVVPEFVEKILDKALDKAVDDECGFTFEDSTGTRRERWIEVYEQQIQPQVVLNTKFGNPNTYYGYGLELANKMFINDPGYPKRVAGTGRSNDEIE